MTLLNNCDITQIMECIADATKMRVIASLSDPIDEVFPYLNATVSNITYNHNAKVLVIKKQHRLITIYSEMVTMAKIDDEEDAKRILNWVREIVNSTWERRNEIVPSYETQRLLSPVDIYGLLPKTNCKQCGETTCYAFTCALLAGTRNIDQCALLDSPEHAETKDRLWSALIADDIAQV
ncbi:MAG: Fe-S cluster protein [Chloroflexi bacterium]|jgi:ArsR family metal-binding transcriptional regulator|nr:Fe-S cluster protein [Chloroflexota bacterium]